MNAVQQRPSNTFQVGGRKFVEEGLLGKGSFGEVYKVREDGGSDGVYALKKIKVQNTEQINTDMVEKEIGILTKCSHDHIVSLLSWSSSIEQSSAVLILMEYCEGGNLNSRLNRPSEIETNLRWMKELADAMCYLHSNNIVHRDLKPENVLLTVNDSIKLGDFGLAREYAALKQGSATKSDEVLVSFMNTVYMETKAGSKLWMAPEVFDGHYTEKADIFSLGTIFYSIVKRKYLIVGKSKKCFGAFVTTGGQRMGLGMAMRSNPNVMVPLDGLPRSERELLQEMLDYYPRKRPSAREVLEKL